MRAAAVGIAMVGAGCPAAKAIELAGGMELTGRVDEVLRRAVELARPFASEAAGDAQQQTSEKFSMAKAVRDASYDSKWMRTDPAGHAKAWEDYQNRRMRDPAFKPTE